MISPFSAREVLGRKYSKILYIIIIYYRLLYAIKQAAKAEIFLLDLSSSDIKETLISLRNLRLVEIGVVTSVTLNFEATEIVRHF